MRTMATKRERDDGPSMISLDISDEASSAPQLKAAANDLFQNGDWASALELYGIALGRGANPELTLTLHNNRAACELELAAKADDDAAALVHFSAAASHAWQARQLIERRIGLDKHAKVCFRLGKARLGAALCELRRTQRSVHLPMIGTGEETTAALEHRMAAEAHGVACQSIAKGLHVARAHLLEAREQQPSSQDVLAALTQADRALAELGAAGGTASSDAAAPTAEPAVAADSFAAGVVFAACDRHAGSSVPRRWIDNTVSLVVPAAGSGEGAVQLPLCLRKRYAAAASAAAADDGTLASATLELHVDLTYSDHQGADILAAAATASVPGGSGAPVAGGLFGALSTPSEEFVLESAEEFVLDTAVQKAQPGLVLALEEAGVIERVRIGGGPKGMVHVCRVKF